MENLIFREDEFGIYIDIPDYDLFDELEDWFIEKHEIIPIAVKEMSEGDKSYYRLWFSSDADSTSLQVLLSSFNKENS